MVDLAVEQGDGTPHSQQLITLQDFPGGQELLQDIHAVETPDQALALVRRLQELTSPPQARAVKFRVFNIIWEVDGDSPAGLPSELEIELEGDESPEYAAADVLSDRYGYLVQSFNFEKLAGS